MTDVQRILMKLKQQDNGDQRNMFQKFVKKLLIKLTLEKNSKF